MDDPTRDEMLARTRAVRSLYPGLFDDVMALLFRHDPIEINYETNIDEYEPEVETILPRLGKCKSADDVNQVVYEEFVRWFDDIAGTRDMYRIIAEDIWATWITWQAGRG